MKTDTSSTPRIAINANTRAFISRIVVAAVCILGGPVCHATASCVVNSATDDPNDASTKVTSINQASWTGSQKNIVTLRDCIVESNLMTGSFGTPTTSGSTIELSKIAGSVISLEDNLPLIFNNTTIATTTGQPATIDGGLAHRIFFVSGLPPSQLKATKVPDPDGAQSIVVHFSNLVLEYGDAHAGNGAGGGMGAGGALFVNHNAAVFLSNVSFEQNWAIGGNVVKLDDYPNAGGGGMTVGTTMYPGGGGLGGPPVVGAGCGAGIGTPGLAQFGQNPHCLPGGFGGTGLGQISVNQKFSPAAFDVDNGNGTLGGLIGGGGLNSATASANVAGFGGGGGAQGAGGFGGGAGFVSTANTVGGSGGFGGGGGGAFNWTTSGNGGFGAGAGSAWFWGFTGTSGVGGGIPVNGFGGTGAGFGGAVFVRAGGSLQIESTTALATMTGNRVLSGIQQDSNHTYLSRGAAVGDAIFAMTGAQIIFFVQNRYTVSDDIADDSAVSLPPNQGFVAGNGIGANLTKVGVGDLVINGIDLRAGVTDIRAGGLAGTGILAGPVNLESTARIAPGDPAINAGIGTLTVGTLFWNPGGLIDIKLGASDGNSSHLDIDGPLHKVSQGSFVFHFESGTAPPAVGQTYRLISAMDTSDFSAADFGFQNDSTLQSLSGTFSLDATTVYFTVTAVQP